MITDAQAPWGEQDYYFTVGEMVEAVAVVVPLAEAKRIVHDFFDLWGDCARGPFVVKTPPARARSRRHPPAGLRGRPGPFVRQYRPDVPMAEAVPPLYLAVLHNFFVMFSLVLEADPSVGARLRAQGVEEAFVRSACGRDMPAIVREMLELDV